MGRDCAWLKPCSRRPTFEKQFLENLFSSILRTNAGGPLIRKEDEPYAAVLALMLSSYSSSRKGITDDQIMTAVTISESWIYDPYPAQITVSGVNGHNAVPAGEYKLEAEGDEIGRASYLSVVRALWHRSFSSCRVLPD